jgi:hypothetical protein
MKPDPERVKELRNKAPISALTVDSAMNEFVHQNLLQPGIELCVPRDRCMYKNNLNTLPYFIIYVNPFKFKTAFLGGF